MLTRCRNSNATPRFVPFSLLEWDTPWRAFGGLRHDLDQLFGPYECALPSPQLNRPDSAELRDTGKELVITVDLPGVTGSSIDLSVSGDTVHIKASRTATAPEGYSTHRRERASYTFEHSFKLPTPVETPKIEAKLQDGVLTINLPKSPNAQPKHITIQAG